MVRSPRPAAYPARFGAILAGAGALTWIVLLATLPALRRVNDPPVLPAVAVSWFHVAAFVWERFFGLLPLSWGVRRAVAGSFAVALALATFAPRAWRVLVEPHDRPVLGILALATAAICVAWGRAAVVAGLRGSEPLFLPALCFLTWGQASRVAQASGSGVARPREAIFLGLCAATCLASPPFLWLLVVVPLGPAVLRLRERGLLTAFVAALGAGLLLALLALWALGSGPSLAIDAGGGRLTELAPGFARAAPFFRAVGEALGVVGCLVAVTGLWYLLRERRAPAVACLLAAVVLLLVPGEAAEGSRGLVLLWILAMPLAAGLLTIARAFGRAAVPAALVLAFVCLAWPVLDGMGRIVLAHHRGSAVSSLGEATAPRASSPRASRPPFPEELRDRRASR